jgi:DNA (cytosine-5)-methyltransferase 1
MKKGKLNGISLFTGYAGIDLALTDYVRPLLYCEIERYAQGILLSRMADNAIDFAPIWGDVRTLDGNQFKGLVDIIYGGFPCQDISVAGKGAGLEGKRSGLFFEIIRICKESSPQFIFLENVPAIRTRGALEVQEALASIGYDCRWTTLSASEVGANHKRERWFCLATNTNNGRQRKSIQQVGELRSKESAHIGSNGKVRIMANSDSLRKLPEQEWNERTCYESEGVGYDSLCERLEGQQLSIRTQKKHTEISDSRWWQTEPDVGRVANGVEFRVDRIKALGNGVVPLQVKTAFEKLIGISE